MGHDSAIAQVTEAAGLTTVTIKQRRTRYLDEFVGLTCAPDLLALRVFPNAKEITESMAAYHAVRSHLWRTFKPGDSSVTLVAVGDGCTPRTAALFAMRTAWTCHSVDPRLRATDWAVRRLTCWPNKIEDVARVAERAIIVAVHSHADLHASIAAVRAPRR